MLRVPDDFELADAGSLRTEDASVLSYESAEAGALSLQVLVTRPTFVWVCEGTKQIHPQDGAPVLTTRQGSLLVMRAGIHLMSEFHGESGRYRSRVVSVSKAFLRQAVGQPQSAPTAPGVVVSQPAAHVERLFRELPASLATARDEAEQQFRLRELLVAATGDAAVRELVFREAASWGRAVDERIARVVAAHHLEPLQVSDLAELCAMSLSSFKRHFRALYATSPGRWLTQARLKHARSLVLNSDASVAEICRSSGYGDVSNFIRAFRTEYGTTPTALRH